MTLLKRRPNKKRKDQNGNELYQASCACGWFGRWHTDPELTDIDWNSHKGEHGIRRK